ncbi:hypothetical protein EVAR_76353_1 [Eumeta japonica]|uniref:Uncharacterized protein n=1 Tax=Eumeta variegata TaxID=151549 RepID=A0A4C1TAQ4_EUMVA|nr:hypothetical protein EVAR_76353_1 [Eumeta japonica]
MGGRRGAGGGRRAAGRRSALLSGINELHLAPQSSYPVVPLRCAGVCTDGLFSVILIPMRLARVLRGNSVNSSSPAELARVTRHSRCYSLNLPLFGNFSADDRDSDRGDAIKNNDILGCRNATLSKSNPGGGMKNYDLDITEREQVLGAGPAARGGNDCWGFLLVKFT